MKTPRTNRAAAADFRGDLARYGPDRLPALRPPSLPQARAYCGRLARRHYENFSVASLLLPRRLVPHFQAVYAYCRWADDLADETGGGPKALELLRWWKKELLRLYTPSAAPPRHPVMVALRETVREFDIPKGPFLDLLFAFEQDQLVKHYLSFEHLLEYCRYSANPVGRLVLYLSRCYDERRAALADQICTGLQLANFWQDVRRDLAIGRVYLPALDRDSFGYTDADLYAGRWTPAFTELMRFEVERTHEFFVRGLPLIDLMPAEVAGDVELFIRGGQATLRKIRYYRYNVLARRPKLSRWDKGMLLGGVLWRRARRVLAAEWGNG